MSFQRYRTAAFGTAKSGLSTVGYRLNGGTRTTAGVAEVGAGSGIYGALVTFPDDFTGSILWDTGDSSVAYAGGAVNPIGDEQGGSPTIAADGLDAVLDAPGTIGGGSIREALRAVAAVLCGDTTATPNADNTSQDTVFRDFLAATERVTSLATRTSRTVTVDP